MTLFQSVFEKEKKIVQIGQGQVYETIKLRRDFELL